MARPSPSRGGGQKRDSRAGLSLVPRAVGYPTTRYLRSLSQPLLPPQSLLLSLTSLGEILLPSQAPLQSCPFPTMGLRLLPASQLRQALADCSAA